jgi:predicted  nucleic acid-binding Zn-ribbon protein
MHFEKNDKSQLLGYLKSKEDENLELKKKIGILVSQQDAFEKNLPEVEEALSGLRDQNFQKDAVIGGLRQQLEAMNENFGSDINDRDRNLAFLDSENEALKNSLGNCEIMISELRKESYRLRNEKDGYRDKYKAQKISIGRGGPVEKRRVGRIDNTPGYD